VKVEYCVRSNLVRAALPEVVARATGTGLIGTDGHHGSPAGVADGRVLVGPKPAPDSCRERPGRERGGAAAEPDSLEALVRPTMRAMGTGLIDFGIASCSARLVCSHYGQVGRVAA